MHFFLQNDKYSLDKEIIDLRYVLSNYGNQYTQDIDELSKSDIKTTKFSKGINIPVGTLDFVGAFLQNVKGSSYMKPLEIPEFLQKDEYLKRNYQICKFKDLPKSGSYFVKDASLLKNWEANVFFMPFIQDMIPKLQDNWYEHDYVCSDVIQTILSEYRVLVYDDNIVGVQYYSGLRICEDDEYHFEYRNESLQSGVLSFPDSEMLKRLINDIRIFRVNGGFFPKSYTLDIAVTPKGTMLLEVHNFVSCGTYGFCGKELPYMYRDGIDFELESK